MIEQEYAISTSEERRGKGSTMKAKGNRKGRKEKENMIPKDYA